MLKFWDSFDHYATTAMAILKWGLGLSTGVSIGAYGRNGTQGVRIAAGGVSQITGYLQRTLANLGTSIPGFALRGVGDDRPLCRWMDNGTEQCSLYLRSDGRLEARGPGGVLAVGTAIISPTVHSFVEPKAIIHNTTGRIQVQVNQPAGSTTYDIDTGGGGVNTRATANNYATAFRIGYGPAAPEIANYVYDIDDARIFDTSGAKNNTFGGDAKVEMRAVTGAGGSADFAVTGAATNREAVDDASPDDDTTRVASSTPGDLDRYTTQPLSSGAGTVLANGVTAYLRKEDAGARTARLHLWLDAATVETQESSDIAPATAYEFQQFATETDGDGSDWTPGNVDDSEIGIEVQA